MSSEDIFSGPPGSTPVEEDQRPFLVNGAIITRNELDKAEQANIFSASQWLANTKISIDRLLAQRELQAIHRRMFGEVWAWAGKIRPRETNLGIAPAQISVQLKNLCDDALAMLANRATSKLPFPMIATIFHHRLVEIHPFTNGNGRHARLVTNKLMTNLGEEEFTWAQRTILEEKELRDTYISALQIADRQRDYAPLLNFSQLA